jgi:hypothetical protein
MLTFIALPIDMVLEFFEIRLYGKASKPKFPLILIAGPPRSGTSLVAQVLIKHLPVCFLNNLTAVFQRSPITAKRLFGKILRKNQTNYHSYYGKTANFSGPNDALYIWDRWLGKDRTIVPVSLNEEQKTAMAQFFGALQEAFQKPFLNKNNSLDTCAKLVAESLDNSYFICITREPVYLAQSLLKARMEIHGDLNVPYGLQNSVKSVKTGSTLDPISDVCEQVLFHEQAIREQQRIIGDERFWIVSYEEFCENPTDLVKRVSEEILHQSLQSEKIDLVLKPFQNANHVKIETETFRKIQKTLYKLSMINGEDISYEYTKADAKTN